MLNKHEIIDTDWFSVQESKIDKFILGLIGDDNSFNIGVEQYDDYATHTIISINFKEEKRNIYIEINSQCEDFWSLKMEIRDNHGKKWTDYRCNIWKRNNNLIYEIKETMKNGGINV